VARTKLAIGVAIPPGMSAPYAYFTPAIALGYDRDEGLELVFFYGGEPGATARSLCSGACDIACLNTIVGFMGRANEELPMLAVGSKARRAHRYFAVPADSPIATLGELRGKRIACDFPHIRPLAEAALAEEAVPPDGFEWRPWHGSGMEIRDMVEPLRRGEVDALFLMDWTNGDAVARGLKLRHLRSSLLERIRVSSCYWTTQSFFATHDDVLARALRAIQKSLVFSFANPQAALEIMWQAHPETKPQAASHEVVRKHDIEVLNACLEPMRIDAGDPDPRWCAISQEEMRAWQNFLLAAGSIRHELDLDRLYTTVLIDQINAFDAERVRAAALCGGFEVPANVAASSYGNFKSKPH
jgi:NitT/TauT family transport system substrate-binding protein